VFNGPLSGTTRVSRYQNSPTHTHEEEEEGFAQKTRSALSQRGLLDAIKPAYNRSRPDGWFRLTATDNGSAWLQSCLIKLTHKKHVVLNLAN